MAEFDFDLLESARVEWPKRGRRAKPLPQPLIDALHKSFQNGEPATMRIRNDEVASFTNLLNKAGAQLNMRIEKLIQKDVPTEGWTAYHFRTRAKRNKDI